MVIRKGKHRIVEFVDLGESHDVMEKRGGTQFIHV